MIRAMAKGKATQDGPNGATLFMALHGPEAMLKREALDALRAALTEAHGDVETITFDGKTVSLAEVFDELRSYGLMQQHKIIIVDEADEFVKAHREALERYAAGPVDHASLVLRVNVWYKGKLDKAIAPIGCVIKCEALKQGPAAKWLIKRAKQQYNRKLDGDTADMLVRRLGTSLMRLDAEFGKLAALVGDGESVDKSLIDEVVGRGSDEQAYAVQEAALEALSSERAAGAAMEKIHELTDLSGQPPILVAYFVAGVMRDLHIGCQMKRQGIGEGDIAKRLKLFGPRRSMFMQVLRRLDEQVTARLLDRIIRLDVRAKTGYGDSLRNLEGFCASLADEWK
jgi:DNA polymerase-3 subunit delta